MNGVHDLGGMHGFGPVVREENEPVFHADWERRVFALVGALALRLRNTDEFRHAIERMEPARYLSTSYYERWLHAAEMLLLEKGLATREELGSACALPENPHPASGAKTVPARLPRKHPRFRAGDRIRTRNLNPPGHTRLPRYARGKPGVVMRDLGVYAFPDSNAHAAGLNPQHAYTVRFDSRELWGKQSPARDRVYIDLWEDYLEPGSPLKRAARRKRPR